MGKNKFGIPDRWRDYSNYGRVIKGTRFISEFIVHFVDR